MCSLASMLKLHEASEINMLQVFRLSMMNPFVVHKTNDQSDQLNTFLINRT